MKKYKNKIILCAVLGIVLTLSFFWGKNTPKTENYPATSVLNINENKIENKSESEIKTDKEPEKNDNAVLENDEKKQEDKEDKKEEKKTDEKPVTQKNEEEDSKSEQTHICKMYISCNTILNNMNLLDPKKSELVPKDGVIYKNENVVFYEGESVFNVLQREMRANKIHLEFVKTPVYNSVYIEGINNIYEFDCGELSGWVYKVNNYTPNYGCSLYKLKDNDEIKWLYTCDLGKDVGGYNNIKKE